ncbi:CheR family methyltransferase [Dyadobacter arcticus]|uniref:Two-component system CheB/CheR fusion protein n=1 Tax=Dyadobacter arcticus TaxID=1078754 RepID=A0ABX0UHV0_9BACT|nr:CheR family methyltransferase [Dyadobacter arcticus]NIJ52526.1 two-component system CheB/CheR fusion protein [Dyadobacter arcticus]
MEQEGNTAYKDLRPGNRPVPIVAIGGSAGGQQAVIELLRHLPADTGLAYVYIQHLSPDHDSQLDVILAAATAMPVCEATHLMQIEPDHVYIIPPNKGMEVIDGALALMPRKPKPSIHLSVDQFFISLANRQKDGAIGIVLSGMASDGSQGLKAIKVAGGVTFAQDGTAAHQGMPQSAIREGVVDMVLSPAEIAAELVLLSKKAAIFQLTSETAEGSGPDGSDQDLDKVLSFVKSAVGSDFANYKKTTIRRRIIRRMLLYKLETLGDYLSYLQQDPSEAGKLYSDLLINVTSFFRDQQTMDHLKKHVLPQIIKSRADQDPLRVWVAGCSTGQEAYSMAIMLVEILGERAVSIPVQIFATDLSETAITKARLGIYTQSEVDDITEARLGRFFTHTDGHYRVNKLVRDLCVFAPHNLLSDPPFSRMDLISCRNLLIYLDDLLQKNVFSTFHYALKPDGFLLLGKSESAGSSPAHFTQIEKSHKIFARKNNTQVKIPLDMTFRKNPVSTDVKITPVKTTDVTPLSELDKIVEKLLLAQYVPASVVVDQDLEIIQFRGATGAFLQHTPGKASLNLTKMAPPSVVFELRNILHKARQSGKPTKKSGLVIKSGKNSFYADIEAVPITNTSNQQLFLVLFQESTQNKAGKKTSGDAAVLNQQLEDELTALRQDMHSIIEGQQSSNEELQSANEEIVSSNEELQSINEELETSKEEIEASNEELQTINQELHRRNEQLTESYQYSEAILSTIKEATLVLDEHLKVKLANKAFYEIFQTSPERTEGSSISEFGSGQLDFTGFRDLLNNVLSRNETIDGFEVNIKFSDGGDRTILVHARKVVQQKQLTILVVFEDITGHRKAQELLIERQQWFEDLVDNAPALIWVCGPDGKINFLNKAWTEYTGQSFNEKAATLYEAIHPEDLEAYRETFFEHARDQKPFSFEYRLLRKDGDYHWVLENAKPMVSQDGKFTGYIGSSTDIHEQKTMAQQLKGHVDERTQQLKDSNSALIQTANNLQAVLDSSPASIGFFKAVCDDAGKLADFALVVCNSKFSDTFQSTVNELVGRLASELLPGQRQDCMKDVLDLNQPYYEELFIEEQQKWLGIALTRHVHGVAITELDITLLKEAGQQQDELNSQLKGSYEMIQSLNVMKEYVQQRGSFLRSTFHDLRGSFGIITGGTTLLDQMETQEDQAKTLAVIQRNLEQVTQMINQLLDYSRLESGEEKLHIAPFNASAMLSQLCEGSLQIARAKGLELNFSGDDDLAVEGDQVKVGRIAQNLILNALRYTSEGGVSVNWQALPPSGELPVLAWEFSVSDTGRGIPQKLLSNLTDYDYGQVYEPESHDLLSQMQDLEGGQGEGIGLFIVKRLCELLGAKMHVESLPDTGTAFRIIIPQTYPQRL